MLHLILIKTLAALAILAISLAGGLAPLRKARLSPEHPLLEYGEALGGGVFLGIALFHMLPEAENNFRHAFGVIRYPYTNLMCAFGFVLLLFLEKIILLIADHKHKSQTSLVPYILPIILALHALTEGAALGINTTIANVTMIFVAIIVHKGSESFALATNLGRSHLPASIALIVFYAWALMSPLGVLLGSLLATQLQTHTGMITAAFFNAFAAGTFLYIATLHKTTQLCSHRHTNYFTELTLFMLGLSIMAVVEIWV